MSNTEHEHESLVSRVEQLEQLQHLLVKFIEVLESRLDGLSEQFNNQPEQKQSNSLQDALTQLQQQFDERSAPLKAPTEVDNVPPGEANYQDDTPQQPIQVQSHESQLVFDRSESRAVLMKAVEKAQKRLIIVCPWLNRNSINADLMQKFRDCLSRNCRIDIGWGHLSDRRRVGIGWRYDALKDLRQLERDYPNQFRLKLLGTHEKFLVCDSTFAMLGSHNMLTSSAQSVEREVGICTTDPYIIQGLIDRFDGAEVQNLQAVDESSIEESVSLDDAEALDTPDLTYQPDASLMKLYDIELSEDEDIDDSVEDDRGTTVDVEELLRRYTAGERNFSGINLAGANLSGTSLKDANLSKANLRRANLSKANLENTNLSWAKLSEANLIEAVLGYANLSGADLKGAELSAANFYCAKLVGTNLNGASLIQAYLYSADLSEASLNYTNLTAAQLGFANLMYASLEGTNLAAAGLISSNLRKARFNHKTRLNGASLSSVNLAGQNLQKTNMSGVNLSGANLAGAWLCFSNFSGADLTSADLRGADLGGANLEKANLKGAHLTGANLEGAKLSSAIMPDGTVHD